LKIDLHIPADKGLAGGKHLIEETNKTLAFHFGKGLANGQADNVVMPGQLLVGRIGEHEPTFGAVKQRRKARRLGKHLAKPEKLLVAVNVPRDMIACLTHLPTLAKIFALVTDLTIAHDGGLCINQDYAASQCVWSMETP
jgi:hypothetical protein